MPAHVIATATHGRYLVDGPAGEGPFPLLVGFHGYGENADVMLEVLQRVRGARPWLLASVQALHRFYSRGNDLVVASWMTRQDREQAIADNTAYVAAVIAAIRAEYAASHVVAYVGFSQGVAMAYRAAVATQGPRPTGAGVTPVAIVALAGDVPPDVAPHAARLPPVLIGRGTGDQWYTEARGEADLATLRAAGLAPEMHVFDEGHVWEATFIERAGAFLEARLTASGAAFSSRA